MIVREDNILDKLGKQKWKKAQVLFSWTVDRSFFFQAPTVKTLKHLGLSSNLGLGLVSHQRVRGLGGTRLSFCRSSTCCIYFKQSKCRNLTHCEHVGDPVPKMWKWFIWFLKQMLFCGEGRGEIERESCMIWGRIDHLCLRIVVSAISETNICKSDFSWQQPSQAPKEPAEFP